MLLSVIYAAVRLLLEVLLTKRERDQRTAGRPRFEPGDRVILAALTRNLPALEGRQISVRIQAARA